MAILKDILVPDLGGVAVATVIEILVNPGDQVTENDSLITLESDKSSMEIPTPHTGTIRNIAVKIGDKISQGSKISQIEMGAETEATVVKDLPPSPAITTPPAEPSPAITTLPAEPSPAITQALPTQPTDLHAGPAVRRLAYELGIDLNEIRGSGPKTRILKEDVQNYVKAAIHQAKTGTSIQPNTTVVDFSQFGEIASQPLSRIKKLSGQYLHRNWMNIPHVTQFGEADISDMEAFRRDILTQNKEQPLKLSPLIFAIKAAVASLKAFPEFNASLDANGENLILKRYFHIGIAVETPGGLVVPVIRNADQKGLLDLAKEIAEISQKARGKGLSPADMQGGCFTISSLGGIGGTAFTPIINAPEVAILGLSQAALKPVYQEGAWIPKLMLPLSLSYDHRVIDGSEGARFLMHLASRLANIRTLLL